jgi:hypothetical protein
MKGASTRGGRRLCLVTRYSLHAWAQRCAGLFEICLAQAVPLFFAQRLASNYGKLLLSRRFSSTKKKGGPIVRPLILHKF